MKRKANIRSMLLKIILYLRSFHICRVTRVISSVLVIFDQLLENCLLLCNILKNSTTLFDFVYVQIISRTRFEPVEDREREDHLFRKWCVSISRKGEERSTRNLVRGIASRSIPDDTRKKYYVNAALTRSRPSGFIAGHRVGLLQTQRFRRRACAICGEQFHCRRCFPSSICSTCFQALSNFFGMQSRIRDLSK